MRILALAFLLTGCASGDWSDYNYGPADWLNENTSLTIDTMYNYEHFIEPTMEIHRVASVNEYCGTMWANGCAYLKGGHCDIYVGEIATPDTIAHEKRHCRGWVHYQPRYELFATMGAEFRAREIKRAGRWSPMNHSALVVAMAQSRRN